MLFVRIDNPIDGKTLGKEDFKDHYNYLKTISLNRTFLGGGFVDAIGGMIIFEASTRKEAEEIASNDPIIKRVYYKYSLHEWEILLKGKTDFTLKD